MDNVYPRNECGEFDFCPYCRRRDIKTDPDNGCGYCELPIAVGNSFEPDERRVIFLQVEKDEN